MLSFEATVSLAVILMFIPVLSITNNAYHRDTFIYQSMLLNDIIESYYKTGGFERLSMGDFTVLASMVDTADRMGYCLAIDADLSNLADVQPIQFNFYNITIEIDADTLEKLLKTGGIDAEISNFRVNIPVTVCDTTKESVATSRVLPTYMGRNIILNFKMYPK